MRDRLIQSNSAKETTTASSRGTRHQYESPYSEVPRSFRFLTLAPLTIAGYSPDSEIDKVCAKFFYTVAIRIKLSTRGIEIKLLKLVLTRKDELQNKGAKSSSEAS